MDPDRMSGATALIVERLHRHALIGTEGGCVLADLCQMLLSESIDVERAVVGYLVFHPQFDGITLNWSRHTGEAKREPNTRPAILSGPSPFLEMQLRGVEELRFRLDVADPLPFPFLDQLRGRGFSDYFAFFRPFGSVVDSALWPDLPLGTVMHEGVTVSLGTTRAGGFVEHELSLFRAIALPLAVAIRVGAVLEMAETLLGLYLGPESGRNVLRGNVRRGQGEIVGQFSGIVTCAAQQP